MPDTSTREKDSTHTTASRSERNRRNSAAFTSTQARTKYWVIVIALAVGAMLFGFGLLAYNNPMPFGTRQFWLIAERRASAVFAIVIVAACHSIATVAFQTVTNNRILTPSIMGFESLYSAIHTATIFIVGAAGFTAAYSFGMFAFQLAVMVAFALLLYSWLLSGRNPNMHAMLLVGIVIGGGLGSVTTFVQRLLTPSEFDVLTARLFGSVNNADPSYYPLAVPIVLIAGGLLYAMSSKLNVLALGRETSTNLGLNHKRLSIQALVLITLLIATSTALVGPMSFLGFLVATLAYQFADTFDHRYLFPMAFVIAQFVLTSAYFLMNHVFYAQGVVSIIIELVGGSVFLYVILRKGRL